MDHDQRFKTLIREFFADFLRLFFAVWAERFDLNRVEWLDKEVLPNPPEGSRHLLDLVAKLHAKQPVGEKNENLLALVHIEIEAPDRTTELKPRLPSYYVHLRDEHQLSVLPIVIYLKVKYDGIGVDVYAEKFWELEVLKFSYLYVGLPGLNGLEYLKGDNYLGVALSALMRIPPEKIAQLGAEAYRRISQSPLTQQQKYLLADCVNAYLVLEEPQRKIFEQLMQGDDMAEARAVKGSLQDWAEKKGHRDELHNTIFALGSRRFGPVPSDVRSHVSNLDDLQKLEEMRNRILDAKSWDELLQVAKA
jgi:hypothetical protein